MALTEYEYETIEAATAVDFDTAFNLAIRDNWTVNGDLIITIDSVDVKTYSRVVSRLIDTP